jgi:hypothetical protein
VVFTPAKVVHSMEPKLPGNCRPMIYDRTGRLFGNSLQPCRWTAISSHQYCRTVHAQGQKAVPWQI